MPTEPEHPAPWSGWLRRRGRWERVCQSDDLGDCHRRLVAVARRRGVRGRDMCVTSGDTPPAGRGRSAERE